MMPQYTQLKSAIRGKGAQKERLKKQKSTSRLETTTRSREVNYDVEDPRNLFGEAE